MVNHVSTAIEAGKSFKIRFINAFQFQKCFTLINMSHVYLNVCCGLVSVFQPVIKRSDRVLRF